MEERLASVERHEAQHPSDASTSPPSSLPTNANSSQSLPMFLSETEESAAGDLPARVGLLDFKTTQVEPQYLGSSSTFAFAHLINSSLRGAITQKPSAPLRTSEEDGSSPLPCLLPEYHIATMLSNAYFENIQPHYAFLHEPTFRYYEERLLSPSTEFNDPITSSKPLFFLNMVSHAAFLLVHILYLTIIDIRCGRPYCSWLPTSGRGTVHTLV